MSKLGNDYGITGHFLRCDNEGEVIWEASLFSGDARAGAKEGWAVMATTFFFFFQTVQQRIMHMGQNVNDC